MSVPPLPLEPLLKVLYTDLKVLFVLVDLGQDNLLPVDKRIDNIEDQLKVSTS